MSVEEFLVNHLWHFGDVFDKPPEFLAEAARIYQANRQYFDDLACINQNGMEYFLEGQRRREGKSKPPQEPAIPQRKKRVHRKKRNIRPRLSQAVFRRDQFTCQICQTPGGDLTCDHILAESKGGETTLSNLRTACRACNIKRGNRE